jgi:Ceramidase
VDPWRSIDLYCERTDASFWSEPLNALTNLAFLVAAILIATVARRERGRLGWDAAALAALTALVGVGSLLFHTFATVWGRWLDLVFIAAFVYVLLALCLARIAGLGRRGVLAGLVLYAVLERGVLAAVPPGTLGGSLLYVPPALALAASTWYARHRAHPAAPRLAAAVGVFAVAIAVRTVDLPFCPAWPTGTHFLWHLLSAWVLYLAATAVLGPRGAPSG